MLRTLGTCSLKFSCVSYSSVNYSCHVVRHIPSTYLSYNWKFLPFDHLPPGPPSPHPLPLVTTDLISFFMSSCFLIFCFWFYVQWDIQYVSFSNLFHLVKGLRGPSTLLEMVGYPYFLWPSNIHIFTTSLFILYWLTLGLFLCLGFCK